jgi:hypothetical protein
LDTHGTQLCGEKSNSFPAWLKSVYESRYEHKDTHPIDNAHTPFLGFGTVALIFSFTLQVYIT